MQPIPEPRNPVPDPMAETKLLRVVIVTPERAELDAPANAVVLPMYDGELGVLPGHSAFVGQLSAGELRITAGAEVKRYYIDGGFVQVAGGVVNVLTAKAVDAAKLTPVVATAARSEADALPATNGIERENRNKAIARAQGMAKVIGKNPAA